MERPASRFNSCYRQTDGKPSATHSMRRPRTFLHSGNCSPKRACSMTTEPAFPRPVPLEKSHDLSAFDCGAAALNDYLHKYAFQNHQNRSARSYVTTRDRLVVGYYTLAARSVSRKEGPPRIARGLANY